MQIEYLDHLPDKFRASAVRLFLNALKDKLVPILGDDARAQGVLEESLDTMHCIAAICDQRLVGILAIKDNRGSLMNPTLKMLIKAYGIPGGIFRICGLALLHYPAIRDEFYVDGIAVVEEMRSKGIGSGLFERLERVALEKGIRTISLGVVDTNARAEALYRRLGFVETRRVTIWPLSRVFGLRFRSATIMAKKVG